MAHPQRSLLAEGLITGAIGATAVVVWFLVVDLIAGRPFYTPELLGGALLSVLGRREGDTTALYVGAYTVFHYLAFFVVGTILAAIVRRAHQDPNVLAGLAIFVFVFLLGAYGFFALLSETVLGNLAWYQIGAATLLAAVLMGTYLWRTHRTTGNELRYALEGRES